MTKFFPTLVVAAYVFAMPLLRPSFRAADDSKASDTPATEGYHSHPPMRPLPTAASEPLASGPKLFVDAKRGDDGQSGTEKAPWKTLSHALRQLKPGDTLYLRGGTYYEKIVLSRSGTAESPITIDSYPGEITVIDGGLRDFLEDPKSSWQPFREGAEGEFVSTKTYLSCDERKVPHQFLPAAWEPMWGIEDERPIALGHFADSMVPLHGYRIAADLRSANELWIGGKNEMRDSGIYCGPGLWFDRETPVFRDYFLMGLGAQGLRHNERDVFNNIFVQTDRVSGVNVGGANEADYLREGGNLIWGMQEGPTLQGDPFAKFRVSPLFQESRKRYEPGWTTHDRLADPRFVRAPIDASEPVDLRLRPDSPAIDAGLALPPEWPDPLGEADKGPPDIGAIPRGAELWGVGVDGRISLCNGAVGKK